MKYLAIIILTVIVTISFYNIGHARPEYTLLSGNRCINCHESSHGGGQRNSLGAYSRDNASFLTGEGAKTFFKNLAEGNSFLDDKFLWGFDIRSQYAQLGDPSNSQGAYFLMQMSPYLSFYPTEWLKLNMMYNFSEPLQSAFKSSKSLAQYFPGIYPGQKAYSISAVIQPDLEYPSLKIGYFQPAIGTRYDDHTMFVRQQVLNYGSQILPPDNNDWGAELNYDRLHWLQLTAGVYGAKTMAEITMSDMFGGTQPLTNPDKVSYLGKVVLTPRFADNLINTYIGGSYFVNPDFKIMHYFVGVGLTDYLSIIGEMASSKKTFVDADTKLTTDLREATNYTIGLTYQIITPILISARYEHAITKDWSQSDDKLGTPYTEYNTKQIVLGACIYPIPFVEIRPEFRIYDRKAYESYAQQWAIGFHLYY